MQTLDTAPRPGDFDDVIDVRSPAEYAIDHVPAAINLPVLDNEQRAKVGTCYKQVSAFEARKLGAAYVASNIGRHIEAYFGQFGRDYRPLIYCWRGGKRSNSMALVLQQIGWRVTVLEHGYKTFRRAVMDELETLPGPLHFTVLAGLTGTGKTAILTALAERGAQVLDLEGLANHCGSLLGEPPGGQGVSQKMFESRLWHALQGYDPTRPVYTEAESAKIGRVFCPKPLLSALRAGRVVEVTASRAERVRYLNHHYRHWHHDNETLQRKLAYLKAQHGRAELERWQALASAGDWDGFVERLLEIHYDPNYSNSRGINYAPPARTLGVVDLLGAGPAGAAEQLLADEPSAAAPRAACPEPADAATSRPARG